MKMVLADLHLKDDDAFGYQKDGFNTRTISKLKKIQELVNKEKPDSLFLAGDLFHTSRPSERLRALTFSLLAKFNIPVYIISGNHDIASGFMTGMSESLLCNRIVIVPSATAKKVDNVTLIGYTRDDQVFTELCQANLNTYLISHRDIPHFDLPFKQSFYGHQHRGYSEGNKHSIGALFTDSFGEEDVPCRYLLLDNVSYEFKEVDDIKIKTFNEITEFNDGEFTAVRFKLKGTAKDLMTVNQRELQSHYEKTKIFLDIEVLDSETKLDDSIPLEELVKSHLKDKGLTKSELKFGSDILSLA